MHAHKKARCVPCSVNFVCFLDEDQYCLVPSSIYKVCVVQRAQKQDKLHQPTVPVCICSDKYHTVVVV